MQSQGGRCLELQKLEMSFLRVLASLEIDRLSDRCQKTSLRKLVIKNNNKKNAYLR